MKNTTATQRVNVRRDSFKRNDSKLCVRTLTVIVGHGLATVAISTVSYVLTTVVAFTTVKRFTVGLLALRPSAIVLNTIVFVRAPVLYVDGRDHFCVQIDGINETSYFY